MSTETRKPAMGKHIAEPLVALEGGGRHRWWYTLADWQLLRASAGRLPAAVAQADVLAYAETKKTATNPDGVNTGTVWRHRDARAARPRRPR